MKPRLLNKAKPWSVPGFAAIGMLFVFVLLSLSVWPANVQADCSQAYGKAFINEFNTKSGFVEVYFKPDVPEDNYRVDVCNEDDCVNQTFSFNGSTLWVYHELSTIENNDNFDITLYDFDGDVVDYINVHISQGEGDDADERSFYNIDYEDCDSILNSISNDDNSPHLIERNSSGQRQFYRTTDGGGSWEETNQNNNNTYGESNHGADPLSLHHVRIEHDGAGLTCMAETITIRACADADCIVAYTGEVTVDLISPASGWSPDAVTFSGGSTTADLRHTMAETITLDINGPTPTATNAKTCLNTTTTAASCDITFYEAGFIFDVPPQTACQSSANVTISAVRTDLTTQQCVPGFISRTEDVSFWSTYVAPITGTQSVQISDTTIATSTPGTAISLTFDANGESTFDVTYHDAGDMQLNARFNGSGTETGLVMLGSDTFVVKPDHFLLAATKNDGTTALNNTTSGGTPIEAAGNDFRITAQAVCADSTTVTQNYIPTNAQIWIERTGPTAAGSEGTLTFPDLKTPTNHTTSLTASPAWNDVSTSFVNGMLADPTRTYATTTYSEVGLISLHLRDSDYLGETIAENTIDIGRFTPHHYKAEIANPGVLNGQCGGNFTYTGQPMGYSSEPSLLITAENRANTTTQNYTGAFVKLIASDFIFTAPSEDTLQNGTLAGTKMQINTSLTAGVITDNTDGTITYTLSNADTYTYDKDANSMIGAFTSDIRMPLASVQDSDTISATSPSPLLTLQPAGVSILFGRLEANNIYGPETLDLVMPINASYFDGTSFINNPLDTCTALTNLPAVPPQWGDILLPTASYTDNLSEGETEPTAISFANGAGGITLSAPGTGNEGNVGVTIDLTGAGLPWLQYDGDGDGAHDNDPSATATFGIYRGNDRIINWREVIQ